MEWYIKCRIIENKFLNYPSFPDIALPGKDIFHQSVIFMAKIFFVILLSNFLVLISATKLKGIYHE